jgi:hypothetical protein
MQLMTESFGTSRRLGAFLQRFSSVVTIGRLATIISETLALRGPHWVPSLSADRSQHMRCTQRVSSATKGRAVEIQNGVFARLKAATRDSRVTIRLWHSCMTYLCDSRRSIALGAVVPPQIASTSYVMSSAADVYTAQHHSPSGQACSSALHAQQYNNTCISKIPTSCFL